jgi:hypothetical protein
VRLENRELRSLLRLILISGFWDCVKEQCYQLKIIIYGYTDHIEQEFSNKGHLPTELVEDDDFSFLLR